MSAAKAKPKEPAAAAERAAQSRAAAMIALLFWGSAKGATWTVLLILAFAAGAFALWRNVQPEVAKQREYLVGPQDLEITPPPEWIRSDVTSEAIRTINLDSPLSILDDRLAERVSAAFASHPWVLAVERVSAHYPARVHVDLVYRQPVCMVELPAAAPGNGSMPAAYPETASSLLPVDVYGVLLPEGDFPPAKRLIYPRLTGVGSMPLGSPGSKWGDARVTGGAEIAAVLAEVWSELSLKEIVPAMSPSADGEHSYEVFTRNGTRILWGRPPSTHWAGEVTAAEKIARLRYEKQRGFLDGSSGAHDIDVRIWQQTKITPRNARTVTRPGAARNLD